ncbi:RNA polymerase III subunit Rpc25-domain-containing protein [Lasiosphaeris hirsuta]|uniref:DNA-directed RNA polymerase subunit n=1 Tax=Lasiosphaeris hirsuta TaxID=260670 RepID=A0AA40E8C5_9PEZI|nr:RNA polymerase III subunit Rpc25-domain-containing protein [Lasiosphaeris hirsuta]
MFILTKIADLVQIAPADFGKLSHMAIEDNINAKYANKVVQKIGLFVCLWDILWTSEGLIGHGDGLVNVNVEFRMVVFRPFKGEVLAARITSQTRDGINLATDFFHDIFVPWNELPDDTEFEASEGVWIWKVEGQVLYYDNNEMVHFEVMGEEWRDQAPTGPLDLSIDQAASELLPPYKITASMKRAGLGCAIWWG